MKLIEWRHSLFWKIVPATFLMSSLTWLVLDGTFTLIEDGRLHKALAPQTMQPLFETALRQSQPLMQAQSLPNAWCVDLLELLAQRALVSQMKDRTGDANANGLFKVSASGRIYLRLQAADGSVCEYAPNRSKFTTDIDNQIARSHENAMVERPDGWMSITVTRLQEPRAPVLTAGIYIFSPWEKLKQPKAYQLHLAIFILCLSSVAAMVLLVLLIRRIRRADIAATEWTNGNLTTRINDHGADELSKLTQKFDHMADALEDRINIRLALAAAEERNRLARDLHDTAKQRSFALGLQLYVLKDSVAQTPEIAQRIELALTLVHQIQQDLSMIIRRLKASTIAECGFEQVLASGIDSMLAGSSIAWTMKLDAEFEALLALEPDTAQQLFLISMEAVANALKHAGQCTRCELSGSHHGKTFIWRVIDNGQGMLENDEQKLGMGLSNMRFRAASLHHGNLTVTQIPSGGMEITVRFQRKAA